MEEVGQFTEGLAQFYPLMIMAVCGSFLYAAVGRAKLFQQQPVPRFVLSAALGVMAAGVVQIEHWSTILGIVGASIASGIGSIMIWNVAMQRGKLRWEQEHKWEVDRRKHGQANANEN